MEIILVSPSSEYKDTFLEGCKELQSEQGSAVKETSQFNSFGIDIEKTAQNFDEYIETLRNKEKPYEERMSLYESAPEEVRKQMTASDIEIYSSKKIKPGADFWIMEKSDDGAMKYIGEMSIRPNALDEKDLAAGAEGYEAWKGSLGKDVAVGVETSSFLIPSARGGGRADKARVEFFKELEKRGIKQVVSKVNLDNERSNAKQNELVEMCGGTGFKKEICNKQGEPTGKAINRYIVNVDSAKLGNKMKAKFAAYELKNSGMLDAGAAQGKLDAVRESMHKDNNIFDKPKASSMMNSNMQALAQYMSEKRSK